MSKRRIRVGIIGFGLSGRLFHTSLLRVAEEFEVSKVFSSRIEEVLKTLPDASVVSSVEDLFTDSNIELIVNCTPNQFHYNYSKTALESGKHVVVEKPFGVTVSECRDLIELAEQKNRILTVFHNRRWDADFLTIQKLIGSEALGEITLFESHYDRYRPVLRSNKAKEREEPGSGILYDLGAHLLDQALVLFGLPEKIYADLENQKGEKKVIDYFHLILYYGKRRIILHGGSYSDVAPRFQVVGEKGTFVKYGIDPQESQLQMGKSPLDKDFGHEDSSMFGTLTSYHPEKTHFNIPSVSGSYLTFYRQLHDSINNRCPLPVDPKEALAVVRLIELAYESSKTGKVQST